MFANVVLVKREFRLKTKKDKQRCVVNIGWRNFLWKTSVKLTALLKLTLKLCRNEIHWGHAVWYIQHNHTRKQVNFNFN